MESRVVLITGASGLLGRELMKTFLDVEWNVIGTAFSRAEKNNLLRLDLTDFSAVEQVIENTSPSLIIHSAAQRAPNEVEKNFQAAQMLNVGASKYLAEISAKKKIPLLYISTDYVFDGCNPPYKETDKPNPTNKYGMTKLEGEIVTLSASEGNIVLRIPVLYGDVEFLSESAITCLLDSILNKKSQNISDYEIRWPSHTRDISSICFQLANKKISNKADVTGVYQWSGKEGLTKYRMTQIIAEEFGLSMDHLSPDKKPNDTVPRPYNCQLETTRLEEIGIGQHTPFRDGIRECLRKFVK